MASAAGSRFTRFLNSETGPKTVHFWAPMMKWALVIAGINDLQRPVEKLSGTQQIALFCTGAIWTRWCLIIKPKNYFLASVNFFLGTVAGVQLTRVFAYQKKLGYSNTDAILNIAQGKTGHPDQLKTTPAAAAAAPAEN
ncbi:mitochondrial pyruvate carrier 3 [Trichomonascus vanleenenianus]|uniref:mitochondrial pyruvate carrier family protein n=1 Tax=Trichomonascus vanleenenianus TaxID=2268995 RepID=UPI003ECA82B9